MNAVLITVMLQFFLIAMTRNDGFRRQSLSHWLPMGIAVIGMVFAGSLLV